MSTGRPNFFLVGSMKSGTTSLHRYLSTHPDVFMTQDPKEPSYFLTREQLLDVLPGLEKRGIWQDESRYLELFSAATGQRVIGEASANYSRLGRVTGVPDRIAAFSPGAKVAFVMRDPVERTISHYWYMVLYFAEHRDMLAAITGDPDYTDTSNYAMQLEPYLALFGRENVFVMTTEELRDKPEATMRSLFDWLGVNSDFVPPNLHLRENEAPAVVSQVRGRGLLNYFRHSRIWSAVGPRVPESVRRFGRQLAHREVPRREINDAEVRAYLRPRQLAETDRLVQFLGRRFPEWTSLYARD